MNSIEVISNPEKKAPQAIDEPTLRVFVKEGSAYMLQHETTDFQEAMKQATNLYEKGKDILVNEKNNPDIVHAKSNLHKDAGVGREIRPNEKDGVFKRAPDIVLESFFEKLPMDTTAFDERERAKDLHKNNVNPGLARELEKLASDMEKEGRTKGAVPAVEDPDYKTQIQDLRDVSRALNMASSSPLELSKEPLIGKDLATLPEANPKDRKVILSKTGYDLPEKVLGAYTIRDGKFNDKDSNALRFEDHGTKLSTPVEERKVIADMIEVAVAKNWDQLELKGTETFRQLAWLEAESRDIHTKGYKPNERDLELLENLRRERGTDEKQMKGPANKNPNERAEFNSVAPVFDREPKERQEAGSKTREVDRAADKREVKPDELVVTRTLSPDEKMRVDIAAKVLDRALAKFPPNIRKDVLAKVSSAIDKGDVTLPVPKVAERTVDKLRPAPAPNMDRSR